MGGVVDSIFGGGDDDAADAQEFAAMQAAKQFKPFNINSTLGTVTKQGDDEITVGLSPAFQGLLDREVGIGQRSIEDVARERFDLLSEFSAEDEADARRFTRERLFRAGRLGTHGGTREIGEVEEALARARLDRQISAFDFATQQRQNAISNAITLGQLDSVLGGMSINRMPATVASGFLNAGNTRAAGDLAMRNAFLGPIAQQAGGATANFLQTGASAIGSSLLGGLSRALPAGVAGSSFAGPPAFLAGSGGAGAAGGFFGTLGNIASSVGAFFSDRRLKTDIVPVWHDGNLQWYQFRYKDPETYGGGQQIGVMADEVEQVFPDAVSTADNGYKVVDYGRIR